MITASIDTNDFSRSLNRLITRVGLDAKRVVKKEVGELIKTLVKLTPPKTIAKSKKVAEKNVRSVFRKIPTKIFTGDQAGHKDVRWLFAGSSALVGVENYNWAEEYSVNRAKQELYFLRKKLGDDTGPASNKVGRRGKQAVTLISRTFIKRGIFNGLVQRIKNNFGRLKAGWMVGVFKGEIPITGTNMPPGWVTKHKHGVRGDRINDLQIQGSPAYTIINRAKGAGSAQMAEISRKALRIRHRAMAENCRRILSGQKEYTY